MYESDKIRIIQGIDNLITTIETRLLPAFEGLEEESKDIEKETLAQLAQQYGGSEDPSSYYEEAQVAGAEHYWIYQEMKNGFLNMTTTWLFHLYEKDCKTICTTSGEERQAKLTELSIDIIPLSNYYKINKELRLICHITKHGDGDAHENLLKIRPDLFDSEVKYNIEVPNTTEYTLKNISLEQIKEYAEYMKSFWNEVYNKLQLKKSL